MNISGSDSEVFDKISQALSSAFDIIKFAGNGFVGKEGFHVAAVVPLLVVPAGTLWTIKYDNNGNLFEEPTPVPRVSYYCGKTWDFRMDFVSEYTLTHLEIVTSDHFSDFLKTFWFEEEDLEGLLISKDLLPESEGN